MSPLSCDIKIVTCVVVSNPRAVSRNQSRIRRVSSCLCQCWSVAPSIPYVWDPSLEEYRDTKFLRGGKRIVPLPLAWVPLVPLLDSYLELPLLWFVGTWKLHSETISDLDCTCDYYLKIYTIPILLASPNGRKPLKSHKSSHPWWDQYLNRPHLVL